MYNKDGLEFVYLGTYDTSHTLNDDNGKLIHHISGYDQVLIYGLFTFA